MVCLRNISVDTLHKADTENNNNKSNVKWNNNNNKYNINIAANDCVSKRTNILEHSPSVEANSFSANQEISRIL